MHAQIVSDLVDLWNAAVVYHYLLHFPGGNKLSWHRSSLLLIVCHCGAREQNDCSQKCIEMQKLAPHLKMIYTTHLAGFKNIEIKFTVSIVLINIPVLANCIFQIANTLLCINQMLYKCKCNTIATTS